MNVGVPTTWVVAMGAGALAGARFAAVVGAFASSFAVARTAFAGAFEEATLVAAPFVLEAGVLLDAGFAAAFEVVALRAGAFAAPFVVCLAVATGFAAGFFARLAPPDGDVAFAFERLGVDEELREECRALGAMKVAGA